MDNVFHKAAANALALVEKVIRLHGPRVSGTLGNVNAVDTLSVELSKYCDSVTIENFNIYPNSLFAIGKVFSLTYCLGICGILLKSLLVTYLCIIAMSICITYCISQFFLYSDVFDRLFTKKNGMNIIGQIEPKGNVEKLIILVGHHDSSYIYPFHEKYPLLFPIRLFLPMLVFIMEYCFLVNKMFFGTIQIWQPYICILGLVFVLPMFGYISKNGSPGAGDNIIGCAIALEVAKYLRSKLDKTRLIVLFTDGEEVGQKGARSFVRSSIGKWNDIEIKVINIDSIYRTKDITLLKSDRNGFTGLSLSMNSEIEKIANRKGYKIKLKGMPLGGGGTDAAQFALKGMQTTSIVGIPVNTFRKEILFHTSKDTADNIENEAVGIVIDLIQEYIKMNDQ